METSTFKMNLTNVTATVLHCEPLRNDFDIKEGNNGHTYETLMRFSAFSDYRRPYTHRATRHYQEVGTVKKSSILLKEINLDNPYAAMLFSPTLEDEQKVLLTFCEQIFAECNGAGNNSIKFEINEDYTPREDDGTPIEELKGRCRSLSVGDVIEISYYYDDGDEIEKRFYAVSNFGFDEINKRYSDSGMLPNDYDDVELYVLADESRSDEEMSSEQFEKNYVSAVHTEFLS